MTIKSKILTGLSVLMALVFLGSGIMGIAAWRQQGRTVNKVSLATVTGQIDEEYEQNTETYPGGSVDKKVTVTNTGTVDTVTRVKLSVVWGDMEDGVFVPDPELQTDNILLNYNTEDWMQLGEYYYYKKILAPGESTAPLIESFTIAATTGNDYAGKTGNIVVDMEILQAGGGAESFWNVTYEELGIEYVPGKIDPETATVEFISKTGGFTFDKNAGDLFIAFKNLVPGEAVSQLVTVTNHEAEDVTITLWNEQDPGAEIPETQRELVQALLKTYSQLTVTDDRGNVLYRGGIWDEENTLHVSLGNFAPGETKNLNLSLQIAPEVGNDFKELAASVVWGFEAMGKETPVPTGDTTNLLPYVLAAAISGVLFVVLTVMNSKAKREAS